MVSTPRRQRNTGPGNADALTLGLAEPREIRFQKAREGSLPLLASGSASQGDIGIRAGNSWTLGPCYGAVDVRDTLFQGPDIGVSLILLTDRQEHRA